MPHRTFGHQGLTTSAGADGEMGTSAYYGPGDEQEGIASGALTTWASPSSTSPRPTGWGENEKIVGRAVAGFRGQIMIGTEFTFTRDFGIDSRLDHIREVVDGEAPVEVV